MNLMHTHTTERRRWSQIHLSSVMLTTLLAGFFLGMNLVDRDIRSEYQAWYVTDYARIDTWGWPCRYGETGRLISKVRHSDSEPPAFMENFSTVRDVQGNLLFRNMEPDYIQSAVINFAVCAILCLGFMALCELSIRRALARRRRDPGASAVTAEKSEHTYSV